MSSAEKPKNMGELAAQVLGNPEIPPRQEPANYFICSLCGKRQSKPGEPLHQVLQRFYHEHNQKAHAGEGKLVRPSITRREMVAPLSARRGRNNKILPDRQN